MPGPDRAVDGGSPRTYRVGVVSDTHVGDALPVLPPGVLEALAGVDLVIHAGDITIRGVLEALRGVAPLVAVRGNHDVALGVPLPRDVVVRVGEARIGVTHGNRPRPVEICMVLAGLALGRTVTLGLVRHLRRRVGPVDCIVFGHFHMRVARRVRGTLVFSPGAVYVAEADPAARRRGVRGRASARFRGDLDAGSRRPSLGILEITGRRVTARFLEVPGPLRPPPRDT